LGEKRKRGGNTDADTEDLDKKIPAENPGIARVKTPVVSLSGFETISTAIAYKEAQGDDDFGMDFFFAAPDPTVLSQLRQSNKDYVTEQKVLAHIVPKVPVQVLEPDDRVFENGFRDVLSIMENQGRSRYKKDGIQFPLRAMPDLDLSYQDLLKETPWISQPKMASDKRKQKKGVGKLAASHHSELLRDAEVGCDAVGKFINSNWRSWCQGLTLFF
jgi:hypothetical protein